MEIRNSYLEDGGSQFVAPPFDNAQHETPPIVHPDMAYDGGPQPGEDEPYGARKDGCRSGEVAGDTTASGNTVTDALVADDTDHDKKVMRAMGRLVLNA